MFTLGIFIHIIFLFSIFDIYFKSPIVPNITPYPPQHPAFAKRLVIFVVDGLRAESFVNHTTMQYLRQVANTIGRWGISNTRVPTESRPGHVAIMAGFYEDPSAVFRGWKQNPVDFDSIINQTQYSWCWGAYDIIDIFTKGKINSQLYVETMDPYSESFSSNKNSTILDSWVFRKANNLLEMGHFGDTESENLQKDKIILFLHLLGTDTSGHIHKPNSENYLTTLRSVDAQIEDLALRINAFFRRDGRTTFLVTSDHGMTDWGSHGTGDYHETQTPYILWGAGVNSLSQTVNTPYDTETKGMSKLHRHDISQVDLAPLMASLLSIPVPVNSIGRLNLDLLAGPIALKARALYSNSRQLLSQYNQKRLIVEDYAIPWIYHPFEPLNGIKVNEIINFTEKLLEEQQYDKLMNFSKEIIELSLKGLDYYHNYYQRPLMFAVTLSFIGWILFLLKFILIQTLLLEPEKYIENNTVAKKRYYFDNIIRSILSSLFFCLFFIILVQLLPVLYYFYFLMPIFLWGNVLLPINIWIQTWEIVKTKNQIGITVTEVLCYAVGSILLGLSFTHRWVLSVPLLGMGLWPFFSSYNHLLTVNMSVIWTAGCILLSVFSFMPVVGKQVVIEFVITAGLIGLIAMTIHVYLLHKNNKKILNTKDNNNNKVEMRVCFIQMILLIMSLCIIHIQSKYYAEEAPVSSLLQTVCWIVAVILPILPTLYSRSILNRLVGVNSSILTFYLLLSVSHEGLFMITLMLNVNSWMIIEYQLLDLRNSKINNYQFGIDEEDEMISLSNIERSISTHDFRRAFFFILYIILAFFGTGNIASLNSFEVRWVICFTTSYQPFFMTTLILLKTLAPFLSVACSFLAVQKLTKAPSDYLNLIVLIYSNIMGLYLFYCVKNYGSWLEIGMSISQFVIVQVITLFIVLINKIGRGLTEIEIKKTFIYHRNKKSI